MAPPLPPQVPPAVPDKDPAHWLYRLTPAEWLSAAEHELVLCAEALQRRAVRPGVTHARRAAGMAWNAVLAGEPAPTDGSASAPDLRYGRSYMEHLKALAEDAPDTAGALPGVPDEVRAAARALCEAPTVPPALITIGKPDLRTLEAARAVIAHARARAGVSSE